MQKRKLRIIRSAGIFVGTAIILRLVLFVLSRTRYSASCDSRASSQDANDRTSESIRRLIVSQRGRSIASLLAGDVEGYLRHYASDAVLQSANGSLHGREDLSAAVRLSIGRLTAFDVVATSVTSPGTFALETGNFRLSLEDPGRETREIAGRFTAVWKRERNRWKISSEAVRLQI